MMKDELREKKLSMKERKKALSISTAELALLSELPVGTVSKIMTGETKNPRIDTMEKLDAALTREEAKRRVQAYLEAMKNYALAQPEKFGDSSQFESYYRALHDLEDKPIPYANSKSEPYPIWGNLAEKKETVTSVKEFLHMNLENRFVELWEGSVIVNEAPSLAHQMIVKQLNKQLESFIDQNHGTCQVFDMGINVRLNEKEDSILIPDLIVICDEHKLKPFGILGAPDFVVEVVSPSSRQYDYRKKPYKYLAAGVRELWLVDPEKECVVTYVDGDYLQTHLYQISDEIPVAIYDGKLRISLKF